MRSRKLIFIALQNVRDVAAGARHKQTSSARFTGVAGSLATFAVGRSKKDSHVSTHKSSVNAVDPRRAKAEAVAAAAAASAAAAVALRSNEEKAAAARAKTEAARAKEEEAAAAAATAFAARAAKEAATIAKKKTIVVTGIYPTVDEAALRKHFSRFGNINICEMCDTMLWIARNRSLLIGMLCPQF